MILEGIVHNCNYKVAMTRYHNSMVTEPTQTLDLLRIILQQEINSKIQSILTQYADTHFKPAIANMKVNLGMINDSLVILRADFEIY